MHTLPTQRGRASANAISCKRSVINARTLVTMASRRWLASVLQGEREGENWVARCTASGVYQFKLLAGLVVLAVAGSAGAWRTLRSADSSASGHDIVRRQGPQPVFGCHSLNRGVTLTFDDGWGGRVGMYKYAHGS